MNRLLVFIFLNLLITIKTYSNDSFRIPPSGGLRVSGQITETQSPEVYEIGGLKFKFNQAKTVAGYRFDQISKNSLVGKKVDALLDINSKGENILTAFIPHGLYTTQIPELSRFEQNHYFLTFENDKTEFRSKDRLHINQVSESYKVTLKNKREIKPFESALIISFNGAQGETFGAVMGHFSMGQAIVLPDGSLEGEITNYYPVKNGKNIEPGHTNIVDFFGNLTSGQSMYRPSYTLVIYGLNAHDLGIIRDHMNSVFDYLYANRNFDFSINSNCVTATCTALEKASKEYLATEQSLKSKVFNKIKEKLNIKEDQSGKISKILYFLLTDSARFLPRKAFERLLQNAFTENDSKMDDVVRIDYIFQGQVPSSRPRGTMSPGNLWQYTKAGIKFQTNKIKQKCIDALRLE